MSDEHAFDCNDDQLFGGGKPKPMAWRAGPVRVDYSRESRGALVLKVKDARETLEEYERLYVSKNERAYWMQTTPSPVL